MSYSAFSQISPIYPIYIFFFFNDTATTEIYTLSLHDALPISTRYSRDIANSFDRNLLPCANQTSRPSLRLRAVGIDRKSTRLNSSHSQISYAVFCLKKKKKQQTLRISRY